MPWPLPEGDAELLALAKSYPFTAFPDSYLLRDGQVLPMPAQHPNPDHYAGRVPVIAHGSNRAPDQLRRKYGTAAEIPVSRAWLHAYDVVYSAHVTRYGSIAANLHHAPGMQVEVFVTWLDAPQLARMHETELGGEVYVYGRMTGIGLDLDHGPADALSEAHVYLSRRGCLATEGQPLALAEVGARKRPHAAITQGGILDLVHGRHGGDLSLNDLILRAIRDPAYRRALIAAMGDGAAPTSAPHFEELRR
ncbi:MAG: hypothetical protein ACTSW2_09385 [Alphaproteobacteria bacterium]